jgi:hypothetical protein
VFTHSQVTDADDGDRWVNVALDIKIFLLTVSAIHIVHNTEVNGH